MRVIGSQDISTRFLASGLTSSRIATYLPLPLVRPTRVVAGRELLLVVAPLGLFVDRRVGYAAQLPDHVPVGLAEGRRERAARRLVHERHELVREARHRAADADAADVRASPEPVHPTPLGHVAVDHGPPAADLHLALGRVVVHGEVALLVVAGPVTALVDRLPEEP